jgi:hypothetical protein
MELQRVFKRSYMESLKRNINIADYRGEKFPYDETQVRPLANVYRPEGLLEKLDPEDDFKTAIAIYEAYKDLDPLVASLPDLWVYLAHVDLFPYVQKRWGGVFEEDVNETFIINHWHKHSTHFLRTIFAGLWWNVYLTVDENRTDKYELTRVMYECGQDWRIMRFGELSLIRQKEACIGVLEFLKENPEIVNSHFTARGQFISRYFNLLGGIQQLSYLEKDFFKNKLYEIKDRILEIKSVEDIHHQSIDL